MYLSNQNIPSITQQHFLIRAVQNDNTRTAHQVCQQHVCRTERETKNRKEPEHGSTEKNRKRSYYTLLLNPPLFFCHPWIPAHNNHLNWDCIFQRICKWQIQHGCNSQDTSWGALKRNRCPVLTLNNHWCSPIPRHPQCSFIRTLEYSLSKTCPYKRGLCLLATLLSQRKREDNLLYIFQFLYVI